MSRYPFALIALIAISSSVVLAAPNESSCDAQVAAVRQLALEAPPEEIQASHPLLLALNTDAPAVMATVIDYGKRLLPDSLTEFHTQSCNHHWSSTEMAIAIDSSLMACGKDKANVACLQERAMGFGTHGIEAYNAVSNTVSVPREPAAVVASADPASPSPTQEPKAAPCNRGTVGLLAGAAKFIGFAAAAFSPFGSAGFNAGLNAALGSDAVGKVASRVCD